MNPKRFEVTENHIKLLNRMRFNYNDYCEFGAPEVDPKRPYGNSDVYGDIGEILDIEPVEEGSYGDKQYSKSQRDSFLSIHKEMQTVLNILVRVATDGISPGWYIASAYGNDWKREA